MFLTAFVDFPGISSLIPWNSVLSNDDSLNGSCSLRYQSLVILIGFESPVSVIQLFKTLFSNKYSSSIFLVDMRLLNWYGSLLKSYNSSVCLGFIKISACYISELYSSISKMYLFMPSFISST